MDQLSEEQRKIERLLIDTFEFIYARTILDHLPEVVKRDCYGCEISHPSQTHHPCLMWTELEQLDFYFDQIFEEVSSTDTIKKLKEEIQLMDIPDEYKDTCEELCSKHMPDSKKLRHYAGKLILLKDRFGDE